MGLNWMNSYAIAKALNDKYQNTVDVMNLDHTELVKMIIGLDNWEDSIIPNHHENCHDIIREWINLTY